MGGGWGSAGLIFEGSCKLHLEPDRQDTAWANPPGRVQYIVDNTSYTAHILFNLQHRRYGKSPLNMRCCRALRCQ